MKARWRDERTEAADEVEWVEKHGVRAVFPRALESNTNAAVRMLFETVERERRPRDVPTQTLEALAVAAVHCDGGVDVDATGFGPTP